MIEEKLRSPYQRFFVDPVAKTIGLRLHPVQVTLLSALIGLLVVPALYFHQQGLAILFILFSGYLDTLDGSIARQNQQTSDWGTVMDIMADRLVECSLVLGIWLVSPATRSFWALMMLISMLLCISSFLVVGIFSENQSHKSFHYSPGLMERAEAFLFFIAMILWPAAFQVLALLFCLLVLYTAIVRVYEFYQICNTTRAIVK